MISGGGRTLLNILDAIADGRLHASVPLVIASADCPGVARCRERGLRVDVITGQIPWDRLGPLLQSERIDWVVLAGYLKLVDVPPQGSNGRSTTVDGPGWRLRGVVNIHPALLPKFGGKGMYGMRVHEAVIAAQQRESGCTVHLCDATYDTGAIVLQARCPVLAGDTPQALADRVFALECEAYPRALRMLLGQEATA